MSQLECSASSAGFELMEAKHQALFAANREWPE
jgi:hypothetical protein